MYNLLISSKNDLFTSSGRLKSYSDKIWVYLSDCLEDKMTANNIYIALYKDRHEWQTKLRKEIGLYEEKSHDFSVSDSSINSNSDRDTNDESEENNLNEGKMLHLTFDIPYRDYYKMNPVEVMYGKNKNKKKYSVLKQGVWTDIINDALLKHHKLPCCFIYKRCRVANNLSWSKYFLTFNARCNEKKCSATLFGWSTKEPEIGGPLTVEVVTQDTYDKWKIHEKKRPLKGSKRMLVGKELLKDCASNWQRNAVSDLEFGDVMPSNIYDKGTLRKCKQEYKDNILGITKKDALTSLIELKHTSLSGIIHTISADKFFAHYWSQHQLIFYNTARKNSYSRLCIDATGSIIKKLHRSSMNLLSSHIFLYEAVLNNSYCQLPVTQMVSEKQDTLSIYYWLGQWIRDGALIPHEVVSDYSKAILGAISRAFCNGISLHEYNERCFKIINNNCCNIDLPQCYIRIDISHLIKMVCRWKCLLEKHKYRLREFYVRCVRLLIGSETMKEFEDILINILTVAMSETEGVFKTKNGIDENPSEVARKTLLDQIKGADCIVVSNIIQSNEFNDDTDNCKILDDETSDNDIISSMNIFLQKIEDVCARNASVTGNRISPYYMPGIKKNILRIAKEFPMWSNIMKSYFKSPYENETSAPVEGDFNELKNRILMHESKPLKVDRFIVTHINSIENSLKIARSNQKLQKVSSYIDQEKSGLYKFILIYHIDLYHKMKHQLFFYQ